MSVVIIGAGHAGGTAAIELRRAGYADPITLIGEEAVIPYQRPPLSKAWLVGDTTHDRLALRPEEWYAENRISLLLDTRATLIDRAQQHVQLSGHSSLLYSHLIIATGARARRLPLPGADLPGVLTLRDTRDATLLRNALKPNARVAIIGGGYVGLETAASSRKLGAQVCILEREPRVLARVACPLLSAFFTRVHEGHGVAFELGADIVRFVGSERVQGVQLVDGRTIDCDVAIVGVGAIPNDELASAAGINCKDGIIVDSHTCTSDPLVYAIGDVSRRSLERYRRQVRLESVPNAIEQAKLAAATICKRPKLADELPWFWSDQYDIKLQIAGLAFDCDDIVVRCHDESKSFSLFHMRGDHIQAVEAVNAPGDFLFAKGAISKRVAIDHRKLRDASIPIRSVSA
jgi:3-phenylpropionate/trans-cinnamate dioxygenase ferredoxin reductase subunit